VKRNSGIVVLSWSLLITLLVVVELAEITHLFTLPVQAAFGDPLTFVFALIFTTLVALVGAIFIGIYISARILSPSGFTPFEEEMLRMRNDLHEVKEAVEEIRRGAASDGAARPTDRKEGP
jgi:uncharacterized membrane protein (DUF106 family)